MRTLLLLGILVSGCASEAAQGPSIWTTVDGGQLAQDGGGVDGAAEGEDAAADTTPPPAVDAAFHVDASSSDGQADGEADAPADVTGTGPDSGVTPEDTAATDTAAEIGPPECDPAPEVCDGKDNDCDGKTDNVTCDDGNVCTVDECDPKLGCVHPGLTEICDDGNVCTADTCDAVKGCKPAGPVDCNDDNPCTSDTCDPGTGCVHLAKTGWCDDGSICTAGDHCAEGQCVPAMGPDGPALLNCDDKKPCTADSCEAKLGCVHAPIKNCQ